MQSATIASGLGILWITMDASKINREAINRIADISLSDTMAIAYYFE
jgi:hypothetical protein